MYQFLLKPLFTDIKTFVLDTLFPITCLACEQEGAFICPNCKSQLKKLEHQRCIVCQKPTPFGLTHPVCQTPLGANGLISFYDYHNEKVSNIIIKGKYSFLPEVYKILGQMIAEKLKTDYPELLSTPYTLTPIPLHSSRLRWRGFNQAEILCQTLSEQLNLPVADVLTRTKITKTQKDLKKEARIKNVAAAFTVEKGLDPSLQIHDKNFILIDDVTTTGATLQQAAQVLKRNGATKIICLTVARD